MYELFFFYRTHEAKADHTELSFYKLSNYTFFSLFSSGSGGLGLTHHLSSFGLTGLVSAKRDSPAHKHKLTVTLITINSALLFCV